MNEEELKTLDDLEIRDQLFLFAQSSENNNQIPIDQKGEPRRLNEPFVISSDIRNEAMKYISAIKNREEYPHEEFTSILSDKYSIDSEGAYYVIEFIMVFFDITKKELNDRRITFESR